MLDVSVVVSRSCTVSTERAAEGAALEGACPGHVEQHFVREPVVGTAPRSTAPRLEAATDVREHLYLDVNF